jgi:hypothetical protein
VTCDGRLVGTIASFVMEGQTEITYWIERAAWGAGIVTRAVALLLDLVSTRPLHSCGQRQCRLAAGPPEIRLQDHRNRDLVRCGAEGRDRGNDPPVGLTTQRMSASSSTPHLHQVRRDLAAGEPDIRVVRSKSGLCVSVHRRGRAPASFRKQANAARLSEHVRILAIGCLPSSRE